MRHTRVGAGLLALLLLIVGLPRDAQAERTQIFSLQGADCADCSTEVEQELKKIEGFKKSTFDRERVEMTVTLEDGVTDAEVLIAIARAGLTGVAAAGQGAYLPHPSYPPGADVVTLTRDGRAVGPLEKLRVPGKFTVFDVYADWCGPCRTVDEKLREVAAARPDVAIRKLNVVSFESPLALELGAGFEGLPYVVVFDPKGKRTVITGSSPSKLDQALKPR